MTKLPGQVCLPHNAHHLMPCAPRSPGENAFTRLLRLSLLTDRLLHLQRCHGAFYLLPPYARGALMQRPSPVPILLAMALLEPQLGDSEKFYVCRSFISRLCDVLLLFRKQPRTLPLKVTIILLCKRHNFVL